NFLFFSGNDGSGAGLWRTDGTGAGTIKLTSGSVSKLTDVAGTLFFTIGTQLWKSDGTPGGTVPIKSFATAPSELHAANRLLFFLQGSLDIWKSDGTSAGTVPFIQNVNGAGAPQQMMLTELNGTVFLRARDPVRNPTDSTLDTHIYKIS